MPVRPVILGLGSGHGDDAAGWLVVGRLRDLGWPPEQARVLRKPSEVLDWSEPGRPLVVCDACAGTGPLGTRRRWTWPRERWPVPPARGTHDLPLAAVLELGRATGRLPPEVAVWTIEGRDWSPGAPVSPAVAGAARLVAEEIAAEEIAAEEIAAEEIAAEARDA